MSADEIQGHLLVTRVSPDGPADRAGVSVGDIILGVGTDAVRTQARVLPARMGSRAHAGDDVPLKVLQGIDVKDISVRSIDRVEYFRPQLDDLNRPRRRRGNGAGCSRRRRGWRAARRSRAARMRVFARCRRSRARPTPSRHAPCRLFALTIFASAFLLFLVQPIIAKQILPWFGGSAAVWTTCLVFFQTALLAGYAYADVVVRRLALRSQVLLHVALLVASLVVLPIVPGAFWKPLGGENPACADPRPARRHARPALFPAVDDQPAGAGVVRARAIPDAIPIGCSRCRTSRRCWRSLGYPFLIEPWIPTRMQAYDGRPATSLFVVLCAATALAQPRAMRAGARTATPIATYARRAAPRRPRRAQLLWCALAATGSVLLLAVTNHITQNIAAVPLLWIVPLTHLPARRSSCASTAAAGIRARSLLPDRRRGARRHGVVRSPTRA